MKKYIEIALIEISHLTRSPFKIISIFIIFFINLNNFSIEISLLTPIFVTSPNKSLH